LLSPFLNLFVYININKSEINKFDKYLYIKE
jgi:hypothetical protein